MQGPQEGSADATGSTVDIAMDGHGTSGWRTNIPRAARRTHCPSHFGRCFSGLDAIAERAKSRGYLGGR